MGKMAKRSKARDGKFLTLALLTAATFGVGANVATAQTDGERSLALVAATQTGDESASPFVVKEGENCCALFVGVDEYLKLCSLAYASSDVAKLADALETLNFKELRVRILATGAGVRNRPSREGILKALDEVLAASGPDSIVIIALSGHGFES